jgi:hypothetical protein
LKAILSHVSYKPLIFLGDHISRFPPFFDHAHDSSFTSSVTIMSHLLLGVGSTGQTALGGQHLPLLDTNAQLLLLEVRQTALLTAP